MSNPVYVASLSPSNVNTATYNTITKSVPDLSNNLIANLSPDNYPAGQVPEKDKDGYLIPNLVNQAIFKNQPLSWWIESFNSGKIQYRPMSNLVNWAYINSNSQDIYIIMDVSLIIIPNRTRTVTQNPNNTITTFYEDNNCLLLNSTVLC